MLAVDVLGSKLNNTFSAWLLARLFQEFGGLPFKPFLALETAEMDGFAFVGDFEFCCVFVEHHAANWVSKHLLWS